MNPKIYRTVLDTVGHTPLIQLNRIHPGQKTAPIAIKFEAVNPGGSIKDRIAVALIDSAETENKLEPGGLIVEATAGNTGIALAMAAAVRGYRALMVVPDKMSPDKVRILKAYGAEVKVVPDVPKGDPNHYQTVAKELASSLGGCYMGQFENQANPFTHYVSTGKEIWDDTAGTVGMVVAGAGTGGTITGIGRYLKEKNPEIRIIGADPEGSIFTGPLKPFRIEGMGEDYYPETLDMSVVDKWVAVSDEKSFTMARRLAREEGMLVGGSTGAIVEVALRMASEVDSKQWIVAISPDSGRNYLNGFFAE